MCYDLNKNNASCEMVKQSIKYKKGHCYRYLASVAVVKTTQAKYPVVQYNITHYFPCERLLLYLIPSHV